MLKEIGRVVAAESGALWVEVERKSACGSCAARGGCGHGLLQQLRIGKSRHVRVLDARAVSGGIEVGQEVEIGLPAGAVLAASVMLYLVPLAGLLLGSGLAAARFPGDAAAALGGAAGAAVSFGLVRLHALRRRNDRRWQPLLLRTLHDTQR